MSGALSTLFGGSTSTQKPVNVTPPEIAGLRGDWASTLSNIFQNGTPAYQGPFNAPITGAEQNQLGQLQNSGMGRQGLIESTISGNFLPGQPGANPFFDAAVRAAQRPTLQGLEETLTRSLPGRFTSAGQFNQPHGSSAFDRAAAIATRGAADAVGNIATNMGNQQYQQERGLQQQAVQLGQNEVQSMIANLQAQGLPRLIEEIGIERALPEFQSRVQSLLQALQLATGASGLNQIAQQGQSTQQGGIVQGLAALYGPRTGTARS